MNIWHYLYENNLAGLAIFSLEDIFNTVNKYQLFVSTENYKVVAGLKEKYKKEHDERMNTEVPNAKLKYEEALRNNDIPDEDPELVEAKIKSDYRSKLLELIKTFYDYQVFHTNKYKIQGMMNLEDNSEADKKELEIALIPIRRNFYTFLSAIGYYQQHKGYFLSKEDWKKINAIYSKEVAYVNSPLGYDYRQNQLNIFAKWGRLDDKYIDIDKISLMSLVLKYFNTNIKELIEIARIVRECFDSSIGNAWPDIQERVKNYIKLCESKNLMVKL